jgi:hypothetical protein
MRFFGGALKGPAARPPTWANMAARRKVPGFADECARQARLIREAKMPESRANAAVRASGRGACGL